jgi:hypothetical protein
MPKRPPPDPMPLAVLIPPIVARAMEGPRPAWKPDAAAPVCRYRPRRYFRHPGQLALPIPQKEPDCHL